MELYGSIQEEQKNKQILIKLVPLFIHDTE